MCSIVETIQVCGQANRSNIGLLQGLNWESEKTDWKEVLKDNIGSVPTQKPVLIYCRPRGGHLLIVGSKTTATYASFIAFGYGMSLTDCQFINGTWTFK